MAYQALVFFDRFKPWMQHNLGCALQGMNFIYSVHSLTLGLGTAGGPLYRSMSD